MRSLVRDHGVAGLTRQEAVALLGSPDDVEPYPAFGRVSTRPDALARVTELWYIVGWSGCDPDFLVLEFGADGKVRRWFVAHN